MNALIEFIKAITPFVTASMPFLMLLGGYWINRATKKTSKEVAAAQTTELKAHSDENREKTVNAVASVSGTFKAMPGAKSDGP